MTKKRRRSVHLHVMVTPEEQALIADRMAEAGISNMGAYMRKIALNGYVLHVDLSDIRELVALQRQCANNLPQAGSSGGTQMCCAIRSGRRSSPERSLPRRQTG